MCVCGCVGFFWHGAATPNIAHCTQRTGAAEKRGKKKEGRAGREKFGRIGVPGLGDEGQRQRDSADRQRLRRDIAAPRGATAPGVGTSRWWVGAKVRSSLSWGGGGETGTRSEGLGHRLWEPCAHRVPDLSHSGSPICVYAKHAESFD